MTKMQLATIERKLARIRKLAEEVADVFGDDPMEGELFTAVNNIVSACDWAQERVEREVVR